ncbi:MAG: hypothetical protein ACR2LV_10290 [Solirubrobacteraceae bacterium]
MGSGSVNKGTWRQVGALGVVLTGALLAGRLVIPVAASAQVQPYGTHDFGGFRNILPPGTNGLANLLQLLQLLQLHRHVAGALNRVYCGGGSLAGCAAALEGSLRQAIVQTPAQVYPADGTCTAGDQMCSDSIQFRSIGAISQPLIEWVNRPTFQQAVEIQGHGPR